MTDKVGDGKSKDKKDAKDHSFVADQQNWEQRVRTELESGQKWSENWGTLFAGDIPNDCEGKIKYLEGELKKTSNGLSQCRYGLGEPFKEVGKRDFRRKKMFNDEIELD